MQQRLHITRNESVALLTLVALLLVGIGVQALQRQPAPPPTDSPLRVKTRSTPPITRVPGANRGGDSAHAAAEHTASDRTPSPAPERQVDLNTASIDELKRLPGIGPVLADRIMHHREAYGPFLEVGDLTRVRGIGAKTLAQLEPLVAVRGTTRNVSPE